MKIELTEEEREFLLRVCIRAKKFASMGLTEVSPAIMSDDMEKIELLINKLSEKKCDIS